MALEVVPTPGSTNKWRVVEIGFGGSKSTHNTKQAAINAAKRKANKGERITATDKNGRNKKVIRSGSKNKGGGGRGGIFDDIL
jgi:hypothetical protein